MADLTALTAQVAQNTTVEGSAITLINGLAAQIAAAGTDPVALAALQTQLKTSSDALAAAIFALIKVTESYSQEATCYSFVFLFSCALGYFWNELLKAAERSFCSCCSVRFLYTHRACLPVRIITT